MKHNIFSLHEYTRQDIFVDTTDEVRDADRFYIMIEADEVIAKLKTALSKATEAQRWRKFPDEKPKWGEEVLVVDDASKQYIVRFSYNMKWISWGNMNTCESDCVKYWMPLPKTPEDDK